MNLYLILLFSLTTLFLQSYSSPNDRYDACSKNLTCGSLGELSYPFYDGSTRPEYCGYPGFKIDCSQGIPYITISDQEYHLKAVNSTDRYSIRISRKDLWSGNCPDSLTNTTMDFSKLNFSSATRNITFFYNCSDSDELSKPPLQTTCEHGGQESTSGYYLTEALMEKYKSWNFYQSCESNIFLPVSKTVAEAINSGQNELGDLIAAFEEGFELGLIVNNSACDSCIKSDGVCGYDWGSEKFVCHCADGDYKIQCGAAGSKNKLRIAIGSSIGAVVLLALLGGCFVFARRRRSQRITQYKTREVSTAPASSTNGLTSSAYTTSTTLSQTTASYTSSKSEIGREKTSYFGVHVFEYSELEHATCNFHDSKELGDGGFGTVYYGVLPDGRQVAVKRLYENSFKRVEQFMNEIRILADLQHKNLVALYGCTSRRSRELLLVYEYIPNGTVADHIHGRFAESTFLPWLVRLSIAVETAEALAYLHRNDVIHRDVKTTNILLDNDFHVKVADFGLSRLFPTDMTHVSTAPQGTPGYVDPEYYQCYKLTEKSDVYSFGVVLVELISSKHAVDITRHRHHVNLANMALDQIQNQELHELVDPRLGFDKDHSVQAMVKMVGELGFRCLQQDRDMRPTMDEVVTTLRAIQMEGLKAQKQEVVDIVVYGDDVGLLTNPTPPLSPELLRSNDVVVCEGKNLK